MDLRGNQSYEVGLELLHRGDLASALQAFERAIALEPANGACRSAMGGVLCALGRYQEAARTLRRALHLDKKDVEIRGKLALALEHLGRAAEALEQYGLALEIKPDYELARVNRGALLMGLGRYGEALSNNKRLLQSRPDWPLAHFNFGDTLLALGEWQEALSAFDKALELQPDYAKAHFNQAVALSMLGQFSLAEESFAAAKALDEPVYRQCLENVRRVSGWDRPLNEPVPQLIYLIGMHRCQEVCDWRGRDVYVERFQRWLESGEPFMTDPMLAFNSLPLLLRARQKAAIFRQVSARLAQEAAAPLSSPPARAKAKIRIGYVSPDFRFHPVGRLTRQLYPLHDREQFEVFAYSLLPGDGGSVHSEIRATCDRFFDVAGLDATELAQRIRADEIDILVDLAGYTRKNRFEVFALRPAPVQVAYLGFPSTTGADFIDYLVTDHVTTPPGSEKYYSEKLIYLPRSYLMYDNSQPVALLPSRGEAGLPEDGVAFCCFNNSYKVEPVIFSAWMRILERVPGSVLWLFAGKEGVERNLRREAASRGVDPARLIFVPHLADTPRYLARYRLADVFLDTAICNAHTTAADALWAGLPVLTCAGETHWSRVAASLLASVGLPELIAADLAAYEEKAVALARDANKLAELKARLEDNKRTWPLFDTAGFVASLEQAYRDVWKRHLAGLPPESLSLPADTGAERIYGR